MLATNPARIKPFEKLGQTSVYRMRVGKLAPLQDIFRADPQAIADEYRFEQRFVTRRAPGGVRFWPKGWVVHFRSDCVPGMPARYWREPRIPAGARIVIFAGSLNPPDAIAGRWSEEDTPRAPADHLRAAFDGGDRQRLVTVDHEIQVDGVAATQHCVAILFATVLDDTALEEQGFGGIIGVGQGSAAPPRLVQHPGGQVESGEARRAPGPQPGEVWVALDRVRDPGNLGTIVRTADAVSAEGVSLITVGTTGPEYDLTAVDALCRWRG